MNKKILPQIVYYLLIVFLSYVMMNKLLNIVSFQINIFKTGVFSNQMAKYLSYVVVFSEFIVLLLLLFKRNLGLWLLLIMIFCFTIYITLLFYNGRYEVCGCGGILNGLPYKYHLLINISLIFSSYFTLKYYKNENK